MPAPPSWLIDPLWDQFAAPLPDHASYHPDRDRRNQWIQLGVFATLELLALGADDRMVGLELADPHDAPDPHPTSPIRALFADFTPTTRFTVGRHRVKPSRAAAERQSSRALLGARRG